jgi:ComF family protein
MAPPPFERAVSYGPYEDRMKAAIHALKYGGLQGAACGLGGMLAIAIAQLEWQAPAEMMVVPVPLHRSKHSERGYNQARLLAAEAVAVLRKARPAWRLTLAPGTLLRQRATGSQAGLTPRQRRINMRGAFSVSNPATVEGRHVLLVDDILTTGATARAAAQSLLKAGAASVWVATLARAGMFNQFQNATSQRLSDAAVIRQMAGQSLSVGPQPASMSSSSNQPSF